MNPLNMKSMDRIAFANKGNVFEQLEYAEDRGLARGRAEGEISMIRQMLKNGLPLETIAKIAEMTVDKIKHLIQNS